MGKKFVLKEVSWGGKEWVLFQELLPDGCQETVINKTMVDSIFDSVVGAKERVVSIWYILSKDGEEVDLSAKLAGYLKPHSQAVDQAKQV